MSLVRIIGLIVAMWVWGGGWVWADEAPPLPAQEQPMVLTRGVVHEAFAEPVTLRGQSSLIVNRQPPANIEEVPPEERPAGDNFAWIPGYWSWDTGRNDFVWVSACWRSAPPNMYWVPGYWAAVEDVKDLVPEGATGWVWIAGFWAPKAYQDASAIEYLPTPPADFDLEPAEDAPDAESVWVAGCWYWGGGQFVRRPGYWLRQQPGWVWEPSHYCRTPRGYVFIGGHWDYALDRRGVLFAPVYFPTAIYTRAGYFYTPAITIDLDGLRANLFVYPGYSHYCFGDYYDDAFLQVGIYPQYQVQSRHWCLDPIWGYDRWRYGEGDKRWEVTQREEYERRHAQKDLRPPQTYAAMQSRLAKEGTQDKAVELARPITRVAASAGGPVKFEQIREDQRQKIARNAAVEVQKSREERGKWEAGGAKKVIPPAGVWEKQTPPERREPTVVEPKRSVSPVLPQEHPMPVPGREPMPVPGREPVKVVTPAGEHRETAPPAGESREKAVEPKVREPAAQPAKERREPVAAPAEPRKAVPPVEEHKEKVPEPQPREPVAQPAKERREPVAAPTEPRKVAPPAAETPRREPAPTPPPPPPPPPQPAPATPARPLPQERRVPGDTGDTKNNQGGGRDSRGN